MPKILKPEDGKTFVYKTDTTSLLNGRSYKEKLEENNINIKESQLLFVI